MLTQHFHSISEIDAEFITGVHDLVTDHMLSVDDIVEDEKSYPENFAFLYTLYFMTGRNSPVAISRAILQKNMTITNRWLGPFKKTHQSLFVQWSFPSTGHEAFIGNPLYKAAIWNKLLQKEMEFQKREGFQSTKITAQMNDHQYLPNYSNPRKLYSTIGPIKKTAHSFQEFLTLQNIKTVEYFEQLESLVEENGITISGHKDFLGIFYDSKYSEVEIEKFKTKLTAERKLGMWTKQKSKFMALWQEGELIAIAPFCILNKNFYISLMELKQQFNFQFMGVLLSTLLERFFHTEHVTNFIPLIQTNSCIQEELFTHLGFDCTAVGEYELSNNP